MNNNFYEIVTHKVLDLLVQRRAILYGDGTAFYTWPRRNRLVIILDPDEVDTSRVTDRFAEDLSTKLQGRTVLRTNHRGLALQVGYSIPPVPLTLEEVPLDLAKQSSSFHLPVGATQRGDLWLSLLDADSILLGGSRGMGKTAMLHGWMQALLHGGQTEVHAWDGKRGAEFGRYADREGFRLILSNIQDALAGLLAESERRRGLLLASGHPNSVLYNESAAELLIPIALVIDEAALVPADARSLLVDLVERSRDVGIYPILATNNPQQAALLVKANLMTRLCLAVPSLNASVMVLGRSAAEKLPKVRGRGLLEINARLTEFQSFRVEFPAPSEQAVRMVREMEEPLTATFMQRDNETERILDLNKQGKSASAIVREMWNVSGGSVFLRRLDQVKTILTDEKKVTTTSVPLSAPEIGLSGV